MNATSLYITTLVVYGLVDIIAVLGLNLQFGFAGIANFAYIVYVSVGAYTYALLTLGPPGANGGYQHFLGGTHLPFPFPFLFAGIMGCVAGALTGLLLLRRLRPDYQALAFFALAFMAFGLVSGLTSLLNGSSGLSRIPAPLTMLVSPHGSAYGWFYVGVTLIFTVGSAWFLQRLISTPWGRLVRAVREDEVACSALGKNAGLSRYAAFVVGCGFAALSGALLAGFLTTWSPAAWTLPETIVFFTALVVGGTGNNLGAVIGVVIVGVVIGQAALFLPAFASAGTISALQWITIGTITLIFIWFRPHGLLAERLPKYRSGGIEPPLIQGRLQSSSGLAELRREGLPVLSGGSRPGPLTDLGPDSRSNGHQQPILRVIALARSFGAVSAVRGVDFDVLPGTITGIMGPNGAGKSTLVGMLAGEMLPTAGRLEYDGLDVTRRRAAWRARHGLIRTFQLSSEFRELSVLENLLVGQRDHPGERLPQAVGGRRLWLKVEQQALDRAWRLLRDFHLETYANERAGALSAGQRRLVELMRALMAEPQLLLLDEPLAGIARSTVEEFLAILLRLRSEGMTIVLVEHELHALHRVADTVIVLARGTKVAEGPMAEVVALPEVVQSYVAG